MKSQLQQGEVRARSAFVYAAILLGTAVLLLSLGAHRSEKQTSQQQVGTTLARGSDATADKAEPAVRARAKESYGKLPLSFEANQGQTDGRVKFLSRGSGYSLFLTGDEAVLALQKKSGVTGQKAEVPGLESSLSSPAAFRESDAVSLPAALLSTVTEPRESPALRGEARIQQPEPAGPAVLHMKLVGANARAEVTGLEELPGKSNYFIGNDPKKWRTNVPNYAKVKYADVYPGVDLVYYGNQGQVEYDFVVQPGADPGQIALQLVAPASRRDAAKAKMAVLRIDKNGDLVVATQGGEVIFHKPVVYQPTTDNGQWTKEGKRGTKGKNFVSGNYVLKDHRVTLEVASYDDTRPLVIDPVLAYSTYLGGSIGGSEGDGGLGIAVDASGNAYVTGFTESSNFPTTPGAFQTTFGGSVDAFVSKLNAAGSALVYSTYLGEIDALGGGGGIAVDASGNTYVTGATASANFPTTPGALQTAFSGAEDAFVSKLNAAGSALVYSTYLGGSGFSFGSAIAVDTFDNAYVTGFGSADFPVTPGAFRTTPDGSENAFVSKLNGAGSALVYSTYLGGVSYGTGVAVDTSGSAYVTGNVDSSNFPTTPGAFQSTYGGGDFGDAFVSKLNATGSALVYSTYLGGGGGDVGSAIAVNASGEALVVGTTESSDFPVTLGAFQTTYGGGFTDAFVSKLNATGSALLYSTYLGGSSGDSGSGIAVDASGDAYVTGDTQSSNFPTTADAFQTAYGGGGSFGLGDAFVSKLNATGSALLYSTYLGGSSGDSGSGIAVGVSGNTYVTGGTASSNFPVTSGAFQTTYGGNGDAFASKFNFSGTGGTVTLTPSSLTFAAQAIGTFSPVQSVTLENTTGATLYIARISRASNDFYQSNNCPTSLPPNASCTLSVMFTPTSGGTKLGLVAISDNAAGSPQKLPLTGTASGTGSIKLTLSPASINFGNVAVGATSKPQTVTVTNVGSVAANFNAPFGFVKETPGCIWHHNPQCGTSLAPDASCEVTLTFTPRAVGARTGQFVVLQGAHTVYMPLSGTGTP